MKRTFIFTAFIVIFVSSLKATTVERLTLDDLVTKAQSIVLARVIDSRAEWNAGHKLILTTHTIQVQENMKGSAPQTMTVTTVGGKVGNTILHVAGMPTFAAGEEVILFLEQSGSHTTVVGLNQGKFTISNDEVANAINGLAFPDGAAGKSVKMPLDEFKQQIKTRITR